MAAAAIIAAGLTNFLTPRARSAIFLRKQKGSFSPVPRASGLSIFHDGKPRLEAGLCARFISLITSQALAFGEYPTSGGAFPPDHLRRGELYYRIND
jgi:hypothetical protein